MHNDYLACVRGFAALEPVLVFHRDTAIRLYRIAQESLTNAVKHSAASVITIELVREHDVVTLNITDDGVGLRTSTCGAVAGMGLQIMQYRAKLISARLEFRNLPNRGLCVHVSIPGSVETNDDHNITFNSIAAH